MTQKNKKIKEIIYECGMVAAGAIIFSIAMNMFLLPTGIVIGGITGIATILNIFFKAPVGITIILLNIPLIIANTKFFGSGFLHRTIIGVAASSIATDILTFFPVTTTHDPLICAILGGACIGMGTGLLMSRGYTTGGTDLIACLLRIKFKNFSTGTLVIISDLIIILGAAVVTRSFSGVFYSIITVWAAGKVLDIVISGSRRASIAFIISNSNEKIVDVVFKKLDRGITMLHGIGAYTGDDKKVIMCVVPMRELFFLKKLVLEIDPNAFLIIADATEVTGEGFVPLAAGDLKEK